MNCTVYKSVYKDELGDIAITHDGYTLWVKGSEIPALITKLQQVAGVETETPALHAQLQRVQEIAHERGVECDRLTMEVETLRRPIHDTACYVEYPDGKFSAAWWAAQDKPATSPQERIATALERIADLLAGKDGNRAQVEASCSGVVYNHG